MTRDQRLRIKSTLAYPDGCRDVRALVSKDDLVSYEWISTRKELNPDQLCPYKQAPKKSKSKPTREPSAKVGVAARSKKATPSRPPKRERAATSLKRPASSKSAAVPTPPKTERLKKRCLLWSLRR